MLTKSAGVALLIAALSVDAGAQNAAAVVSSASRAMGAENLTSITYSGTAQTASFGQSKNIGNPWVPGGLTQVTAYTRAITFGAPATPTAPLSRAFGPMQAPTVPGSPPPAPGNLNQVVSATQAGSSWTQALNIWMTPWGFLKGAAANNATVRQQGAEQVVSWSPPGLRSPSGQAYTVTGYINSQNLVTKVETRVEHAIFGDMLVEFEYAGYANRNGVQVPGRIVQRQGSLQTFEATIAMGTPNPANLAELLQPPAAGRGGAPAAGGAAPPAAAPATGAPGAATASAAPPAPAPAAPPVPPAAAPDAQRLADGVFKIGGNYTSLAIDMGDHILVVESGQSDARGLAVMASAKRAIPGKPIRFVLNSHSHFDHASGLAAAVAEGATILTHPNNEAFLERAFMNTRTLIGDSLSQIAGRRATVDPVTDRQVLRGTNGKLVEVHHVQGLEHSDGMLMVYLPAEKLLYTADFNFPAANAPPAPPPVAFVTLKQNLDRLALDYQTFVPAHAPNPDRPLERADVEAVLRGAN